MKKETVRPVSKHFDALDDAWNAGQSGLVEEGGSRSGKTYTTAQWFILHCAETPDWQHVVARQNSTTIRKTVWKDYLANLRSMGLKSGTDYKYNKSEMTITFPNGAEITCLGMNEEDKIHGLKSHSYHLDEATDCRYDSWKQLNQRCEHFGVLTYNPKYLTHWIYDRVINRKDWDYSHSTYADNEYLSPRIIAEIEAYDPDNPINIEQGTADHYSWQVYGLGKRCGIEGAIFKNFDVAFFEAFQERDPVKHFYCVDWGFSVDPFALVEVRDYGAGEVYAQTLIYETDLDLYINDERVDDVISRFEELQIRKDLVMVCDNALPQNISTLQRKGYNATGVKKETIKSIDLIKAFKKVYTPHNDPLQNEVALYGWATKANGEVIKPYTPRDKDNHAIDAMRYGVLRHYGNVVDWDGDQVSRGRQQLNRRDLERRLGRPIKTRRAGR